MKLNRHEWPIFFNLMYPKICQALCSLTSPALNGGKYFEGIGGSGVLGRGGRLAWYIPQQQPQGSCGEVSPGTRELPAFMESSDLCS